jgi:cystathionine beta-synthase
VAQLPVLDGGQLVGILDESDLLLLSGDAAISRAGGRHHDDAAGNPGARQRLPALRATLDRA